ncbi:MerR family transcriptional regulator [Micromonospora sp. WMMD1082]|uniref:MerR family transcriptional regulator n=1 Tax=Micromonospora sp. WMMD1082 TaxID=3016104 RepID=UPI0024171AA7|nr:MerR family transcriptional regulator [Micromonospora sp. WMMD1082]MDG4795632.1 MerR family transcriptional regulator [Micromonospora sp. WMMD1082]
MNDDQPRQPTPATGRQDTPAPHDPDVRIESGLPAGALARRLGVAPTTLRSWHQRYGLGPTGHRAGQHRRYTPHDVAMLTVMAQLTARGLSAAEAAHRARRQTTLPPADHPAGDPRTQAAARGVARAARRLDVLTLRETLTAAVTTHGVVHTWHTLAGPAFTHISRARYGEPRRALTRRVLARCLSEVFAAVPRPPAGSPVRVLLVAVDDRRDTVALDALAAALAEGKIASIYLGAGLRPATLTDAVGRSRPAAVVVWSHARHPRAPEILSTLTGMPGWRPTLVTAGQGWPPQANPPAGIVGPCLSLADAVAAVAGLTGSGAG